MSKYTLQARNVNEEWQEMSGYHFKLSAWLASRYWFYKGWQVRLSKSGTEEQT